MHEEDRFRDTNIGHPLQTIDDQHHDVLSAIYKGGVQEKRRWCLQVLIDVFNIDWDVDKLLENRMTSIEIAEWIKAEPLNNKREERLLKNTVILLEVVSVVLRRERNP